MPPPAELRNRPRDEISWVQKVAAVELGFWLRLIFLFFETIKQAKKQQFWAGPPVNRLVPKIIL